MLIYESRIDEKIIIRVSENLFPEDFYHASHGSKWALERYLKKHNIDGILDFVFDDGFQRTYRVISNQSNRSMKLYVTRKYDYTYLITTNIDYDLQIAIKANNIKQAAESFCHMSKLFSNGKQLVTIVTGQCFAIYELQ